MKKVKNIKKIVASALAGFIITNVGSFNAIALDEYTSGHGVLSAIFTDNTPSSETVDLQFRVSAGGVVNGSTLATDTFYTVDNDFKLIIPITAQVSRPADASWDGLLGVNSGDNIWYHDSTSSPNFGIRNEPVQSGNTNNNISTDLTWELVSFSGPGNFSFFQTSLGAVTTTLFNSSDGVNEADANDEWTFDHAHSHRDIAFTAAGDYQLGIKFSGIVDSTSTPVSATRILNVTVVPEPGHYALMFSAFILLAVKLKTRKNLRK